ncbi:hypothetical protein ACL03H_14860 [Saccharopolyspora sp. MS10]|uniref:hypothetical protein n=1 Tax=Saccharopolyspora sp. MS10 TaxID=3385973 RepID=UPI0039A0C8D9
MTLLAVERIKLFSTRSPLWCSFAALALTIGFAAAFASAIGDESGLSLGQALAGQQFGLVVVLVLAALTVTTEYRFGTIRTTFQAVPNRPAVLLAKAAVVAVLALVIGELAAFGSWGVAQLIAPGPELVLSTGEQWRQLAGVGPYYALAAVLAVGVGALVRQSAGALTLLVIWALLLESLVAIVPNIGSELQQWMPFTVGARFLDPEVALQGAPLGAWASLGYFALVAFAVLGIAAVAVNRQDA